MKRIFTVLFCILTMLMTLVTANAEAVENFENAGELYEYWAEENKLPDYITGVWSSDGGYVNLTFGVTDDTAGREGAKLILDMIEDDSTVTIAYQTYSLNYLYSIQAEIESYLGEDIGFKSVGVYFKTNRVEVDVDWQKLNDPHTSELIKTLVHAYGDAVHFEYTNTVYTFTIGASDNFEVSLNHLSTKTILIYASFAACFVLLTALAFSEYRLRKRLALVTNSGTVTTAQSKPSYSAIKNAVTESACTPSPETDAVIRAAMAESARDHVRTENLE